MAKELKFTYSQAPPWFQNYCTHELDLANELGQWMVQFGPGISQRTIIEFLQSYYKEIGIETHIDGSQKLWIIVPDCAKTTELVLKYA